MMHGGKHVVAGMVWSVAMLFAPARPSLAQTGGSSRLASASLEELLDVEVTSLSRKEQALSNTGAAIFVISQEDIRRSTANNIPDLLRMVPGVEVSQIDANQWAIAIRGFNSVYSNKVLVMVDGRTVYVNTFSGVFWDQIDVPLENIERIEVIRGPGGTVWGANAVNGVINIITKSAADTKGRLLTAGSGSSRTADTVAQYGADAGSKGAYRVFGRFFNVENSSFPGGRGSADAWRGEHAGFRADWAPTSKDTISVQGDLLSTRGGGTVAASFAGPPPFTAVMNDSLRNTSSDILARWEHTHANGSSTVLQMYDTGMTRDQAGSHLFNNTVDIDLEHHESPGARQDVVWGLDARVTSDAVTPTPATSLYFVRPRETSPLFAGFFQDEIQLRPSLFLTVGSKIEHNAFTGVEYQPSAQLVWSNGERHALWAAAGKAIRQPDRSDYNTQFNLATQAIPGYGTALITVSGSASVVAEKLYDFEGGYRTRLNKKLSLDLTGFFSLYRNLQTAEPGVPQIVVTDGQLVMILPLTLASLAHARNYGAELSTAWRLNGRWKIDAGYSMIHMSLHRDPGSMESGSAQTAGSSPGHQFEVRSILNLRRNLEWDNSLKYVASLPTFNIPGYARVDTRLGWTIGESVELSISGQNLAQTRHVEFVDTSSGLVPTEIARSVFGKIAWRF